MTEHKGKTLGRARRQFIASVRKQVAIVEAGGLPIEAMLNIRRALKELDDKPEKPK